MRHLLPWAPLRSPKRTRQKPCGDGPRGSPGSPARPVRLGRLLEATPFIFGSDFEGYVRWKTDLAERLEIDPRAMSIVGSACLGISLNPDKRLKAFDADSDVDVALVSHRFFEMAWHHLRKLGVVKLTMPSEATNALKAHRQRHIFDGAIATT